MKLALTKSHMKSISPMRCLAVVAFAGVAAFSVNATERTWQPQGGSTDISDLNNWGGTLPGNGDRKKFGNGGQSGDYTVTIPEATAESPYLDKAGLYVYDINDGQKVTFDATGTSWLQMTDAGAPWDGGMTLRVIAGGSHIFNIEGLNAANANDNFGFSLTDGKISFKRDDANGSRLVFEGGTFNNAFSPDGTASPHKNVFFHSNSAPAGSVVELAGGSVTFDQMEIRGKSADCEVLVSGGEHHVYDGIVINTDKGGNSTGSDAVLHVSGGSLTLESSCLWLGKDAGDKAVMRVDGNGLFEMAEGSQYIYCPDVDGASALLSIGGHGTWNVSKNFMAGHKAGSTTDILVEEDGYFNHTGYLQLPENSANASLVARDRARVRMTNASLAQGTGKKFNMTVEDLATAEIKCGDMANNATAEFALDLKDNAVLKIGDANGYINFGNNSGGKIDFTMTGGTLESYSGGEANVVGFRGGPASTYTIAGGTITTKNMVVEGVQNDDVALRTSYTNTVRMTGGTVNVRMNGNGDGLDIRGNDRNAMFLVEDGELNVGVQGGGMIRIGHGGNGNGYHSILRQTGGVMNLGATVNMCDSAADGEVELFGGVARVWTIRGWNQCDVRGYSNKATLYGNGGTIVPWQDNLTFLYTMSGVYVGEQGLTIDTKAYNNVLMRVKIENKDDADGLFVKKGVGTLKVGLKETDSGAKGDFINRSLAGEQTYTRIDEGTLVFVDETDAVFGKNITVKGGATLSLAGTTETLTVDTLTLGDGTTAATLVVDAGDTVVVNDENGLDADGAVVDFSSATVNGEYPVFVCAGNVDIAAVDGIGIIPNEAHDCEWISSYDGETATTTFSIHVVDAGTIGKTITYGNGSVTTNGEGRVARLIANESGSQYGELDLTSAATATVDAGATLTLGGDLSISTGGSLSKLGSGKLVVSGDNSEFTGSFASRGGTLEITSVSALGPENSLYYPLILGAGTLLYSDTQHEAVLEGGLRIAGTTQKQSILRNEGDITVKSVEYVSGAFTKTGKGKLTFDLPAGTFSLGTNSQDEFVNLSDGPTILPDSGEPPASNAGLGGVNFLEGTVKVKGEGVDKTTLQTRNTAILAGSVAGAAQTVLDLEDVQFKHGDGARSGQVARGLPAGTPAPAFRLKNAKFWSDSLILGYSSSNPDSEIDIQMENSEFWPHYNTQIGSQTVAIRVDADNSQMHSDGMIGWGIKAKTFNADFYGEKAEMGTFCPTLNNVRSGIVEIDNVAGLVKFRDGARFATTRGIQVKNNSPIDFEFDGGIFEIRTFVEPAWTSTWAVVSGKATGFTTTGKGLELQIVEGMTHSFNFPIMGDGKVVKTGEGTFELVTARAEGEKLLQYTGGTVVSNGTFVVDGSLVADGAKSFEVAEGAILDLNETTLAGATLSDAGVVTNGTLSAATIAYDADAVTTFSDVAFSGTLFVDFGKSAEDPIDKAAGRTGIVVAHYTGDAPVIAKVKALNSGIERTRATATASGGDIVVTIEQSGLSVSIR